MQLFTKKLLNYFLIGILAIIPIVVILQIIIFIEKLVSDLFSIVYDYADSYVYTALFFTVSFTIVVSIGQKIVKKGRPWVITIFDKIIERIPFLNTVYRVVGKLINMFSSHNQTIAKEVVYVEYPSAGIWVPAYVTNRHDDKYVLFIPTSPNPTSGFTVIVDQAKIVKSAMDIEEATSFIVSVGVDYNKASEMAELP
ncbi:MAG: DUF502 domain-containing protein [Methylovulum sp.]|uniref:DUF502 domain-containing protein n=1 Tax=Methylovulum sp. TaxID=1916980 RepID=UPI0026098C91|nr:DUF502 domain-containing protein [Methylovulum sp.]MDD2723031.1 DUF502 domain-containing protein [Methylovulum sp.]MDD5124773.1 DUF502 domain-containing protein [Methylovulum sp.]